MLLPYIIVQKVKQNKDLSTLGGDNKQHRLVMTQFNNNGTRKTFPGKEHKVDFMNS